MSLRSYIPIEKEQLPELFEIDLANQSFLFGIDYNQSEDFFTVDLYDLDNSPIILGERLVINETMWADVISEKLPAIDLVPMDESGEAKVITFENFGKTVFLYLDSLPPDMDIPLLENEVYAS